MASKIHDYIKRNIVEPTVSEKSRTVIARIVKYYPSNNTAKISYTHQSRNGIIELDGVTVSLEREGFKGIGLSEGDKVLVQLYEGDNAVIIKRVDNSYNNSSKARMSNSKQGGYLPDIMCER